MLMKENALITAMNNNATEMLSFLLDTHVFDQSDIQTTFWHALGRSQVHLAQIIYQKHPSIVTDHTFCENMIQVLIRSRDLPCGDFLMSILPANSPSGE